MLHLRSSDDIVQGRGLRILLAYVFVTAVVLLPCFWQPHVESADYPSRLYNAWLAQRIIAEPVPGLELVSPWTNVLTDLILGRMVDSGRFAGEAMMPAAAVSVFFWGAFSWIRVATGRSPWALAPILAMLSYGVIFHFGFFNHYVSTALSLWILALLWRSTLSKAVVAMGLAGLAWLAHPLPLFWGVAVLAYVYVGRRLSRERRNWLLVAALAVLVVIRSALVFLFESRSVWNVESGVGIVLGMLGTDQFWVFGGKYAVIAVSVSLVAVSLVWRKFHRGDAEYLDLWFLHGAAFLAIPSAIQFPQYQHVLAFISERISLFGSLMLCLALSNTAFGKRAMTSSLVIAAVFFSFLYVDSASYNRVEAEVTELVRTLPPGQRVVGPIYDQAARVPALVHVVDRACLGHCLSYGDYEPATGQFRVRVRGANQLVAWRMTDIQAIEEGEYVVKALEDPIYAVCACEPLGPKLCLRRISEGRKTCSTTLEITPRWWQREGVDVRETR
jgi:hypothetical protein